MCLGTSAARAFWGHCGIPRRTESCRWDFQARTRFVSIEVDPPFAFVLEVLLKCLTDSIGFRCKVEFGPRQVRWIAGRSDSINYLDFISVGHVRKSEPVWEASTRRRLCVLMLLHATALAYSSWVHGPGFDEPAHLAAGVAYWQFGNTEIYRVNPPLARMVAAAPLAPVEFHMEWVWDWHNTRPEWVMATELWEQNGSRPYWYLTVARWMSIPWSLLACEVVWRWSCKLYGPAAGMFSAVMWCCSPLVITNAQLMTPDTAATALGVCACYAFWKWLQSGGVGLAYGTGLLLGLVELTKFTWVILFALWPLLWGIQVYRAGTWRSYRSLLRQCLLGVFMFTTAILVINVGYSFEGSFTPLKDYPFVSRTLRGAESPVDTDNRFKDSMLGHVPVPVPRNYLLGIDQQKLDFERGFQSYLRGQWKHGGWWYYYAYGFLVKEPLGFLVLFGIAAALSVRQGLGWNEVFLLAPAVIVFTLVSSQTGFSHHLRYVLPCCPFVFIWMGRVCLWAKTGSWRLWIVRVCLGSAVASSLWVFPHSHAYFNVIAGGPRNGHKHLLHSNLDWGQDILLLSSWASKNPDKPIDGVAYTLDWLVDYETLGLPDKVPPDGYLAEGPISEDGKLYYGPQPGRYAVFVSPRQDAHRRFEYFLEFKPVEALGYTVYIYELTGDDVAAYWQRRLAIDASGQPTRE